MLVKYLNPGHDDDDNLFSIYHVSCKYIHDYVHFLI